MKLRHVVIAGVPSDGAQPILTLVLSLQFSIVSGVTKMNSSSLRHQIHFVATVATAFVLFAISSVARADFTSTITSVTEDQCLYDPGDWGDFWESMGFLPCGNSPQTFTFVSISKSRPLYMIQTSPGVCLDSSTINMGRAPCQEGLASQQFLLHLRPDGNSYALKTVDPTKTYTCLLDDPNYYLYGPCPGGFQAMKINVPK